MVLPAMVRHKDDGGNTSQRLQHAAAELRRMEAEYLRLKQKMRGEMSKGEDDSDASQTVKRRIDFSDRGDKYCPGDIPFDQNGGRGRIDGGRKHDDSFEDSACGSFSYRSNPLHDRSSTSVHVVEGGTRGRHEEDRRGHHDDFRLGVVTRGMSEQKPPRRGLIEKGERGAPAAMNVWGANRYDTAVLRAVDPGHYRWQM